MEVDQLFWREMTELASRGPIVLDRPKGQPHPRYPKLIYPLDYGYIEGTTAADGDGIDVWVGSSPHQALSGILCTFDTVKRDAEIKLLIGCTNEDIQVIQKFNEQMRTLFIPNPLAIST